MNASVPVIKPYLGRFFRNKQEIHSFINRTRNQPPYSIPKDSLLFLFRIEDVGNISPELPNQVVCYFLLGDQEFLKDIKHSEEFFQEFELVKSG